jgi:hypothetical protein
MFVLAIASVADTIFSPAGYLTGTYKVSRAEPPTPHGEQAKLQGEVGAARSDDSRQDPCSGAGAMTNQAARMTGTQRVLTQAISDHHATAGQSMGQQSGGVANYWGWELQA